MTSRIALFVFIVFCAQILDFGFSKSLPPKPLVGGFGEEKDADEKVKELLGKVQSEVEEQEDKEFEKFEALSYSVQVANGFNYLIKAETDDGYMHVQLYQKPADEDPVLKGYESGKSLEDDLRPVLLPKRRPLPAIIKKPLKPVHGQVKPFPPKVADESSCDCGRPFMPPRPLTGAFGATKDTEEHVKEVLESIRKDIEEKEGKQFETFEAISFSTQTVAGRNYLIKVQYDDGYLHAFVYEPLPHTGLDPELKSYETGKTLEDVLLPPTPRPRPLTGAFGATKDAEEHVKEVLESIRKDIEEKEGKQFETFEAISFSTQTVAGRNYLIKVQYDDGYLHAFVYEPLPHTGLDPELKSYETGKTLEDVLLPPTPRPRPTIGAFGETKDADEHVKEVLELIRKEIEEKEGKQFETFEAISFSTQTVAGKNYLIKVQYDDGYLHAFVYEPLPHTGIDPELKSYKTGKTLEDVLLPPVPVKPSMTGAFGETKDADEHAKEVLELIREDLEGQEGKVFQTFKAVSFATQIVAGKNYLIKVEYDDGYLHALVYEPLPHTGLDPELKSYETGKTFEDVLLPPRPLPKPVGAFGDVKDADDEVKNLLSMFKTDIKKKLEKETEKFEAVSYAKQTVAGANYVIKVETDDEYVHVTIYQPPPNSKMATIVRKVEAGKTLEDTLVQRPPGPPKPLGSAKPLGPPGGNIPRAMCRCSPRMTGGFGEAQNSDDQIKEVLEQIRDDLETQVGKKFERFEAVSYAQQIVAGTNFIIKVRTEDSYLHAFVYQPLGAGDPQLTSYETGKTLEDLLLPPQFEPILSGAYGETKEADEKVSEIVELIQEDLEEKEGKEFQTFEAVSYTTQVVAGTNYMIKIQTDDGYLHAVVFEPLPHSEDQVVQLQYYKTGFTLEDPLDVWED